jgi:hypothetical protein
MPLASVDAFHATFTCEHDAAIAETPVGTDGGVVSTAAQFTVTDTRFESRVTDVTASIANCNDV